MFTDIEGSTALWEMVPEAMRVALEHHDEIVRAAIGTRGGYVFSTGGDGFAAAFARADEAVAAAVAAEEALFAQEWPDGAALKVRMALHTGETDERDGDYFGPVVNRSARLMAAAHGGQVLCSGVTAALVDAHLPDGCRLVDLGSHRLRDLGGPEHVYQLGVSSAPEQFPPLRSLDAYGGNLPVQPTAFVGRQREVKELAEWLTEVPLVTLTGVGGVGKTRLALQVAAEVLPLYRDGVWLVELAGVGDPAGVEEAVATALGIVVGPGSAVGVAENLRPRELLLLLDNCEHLLAAVARLVDQIVRTAPGVRVLATSREGLGVAGEHLRAVPSLELPDSGADPGLVAASDAVRLFVERAREASAAYRFTDADVGAVAELCRRLDGIPLAIELAAARIQSLTPSEIAAHLDRRFKLLTGGRRVAATRHQTLRNAIEWSYQLLEPEERLVLDRLAAFAGGFDLPAASAVAGADLVDPLDVLDIVARLVSKSLVVAEPLEKVTRYRLLETVRDFAWERVQEGGEAEQLLRRHASYFAGFAGEAGAGLQGPDEGEWRERLEREIDNLRAGMTWAVSAGEVALALQPVADLAFFIGRLAPYGLGAESAGRLDPDHPLSAVALAAACFAAAVAGQVDRAVPLAREALECAAKLDRSEQGLWVRCRVANATIMTVSIQGPEWEWASFARQWLADARELGDPWSICEALTALAGVPGDDEALRAGEEALTIGRRLDAPSRVAFAAAFLARRLKPTDPRRAEELLEEAAEAAARARNDWAEFVIPMAIVVMHAEAGDYLAAAETTMHAVETWAGRRVAGVISQFAAYLGCLLARLGDASGAQLLAAWSIGRGFVILTDHPNYIAFGSQELIAARELLSASELDHLARTTARMDERAIAQFGRERLSHVAT